MAGHSYTQARKLNTAVLGALVVLTLITVYAAGVNFGSPSTNTVVALLIASVKATFVALFFMHLKYDKPINAVIFLTGIATLALFMGLTLVDEDSRLHPQPANLAPPRGGPGTSSLVSADAAAPPAEVTPEPAGH